MMAIWKQWYHGSVNDFHYYNAKMVDGTTCNMERRTMNMPKKVCEDFSNLLWSEKVEIKLDSKKNTEKLWKVLDSKENAFSINDLESVIFSKKTEKIENKAFIYNNINSCIIPTEEVQIDYDAFDYYTKEKIKIKKKID